MHKPILIVEGGAYGSESKGLVVDHLVRTRGVDYAVRTGSINAGHTLYYNGKGYKFQQVPVGWANPNTLLVIGAGTYVSPEILEEEVKVIAEATGKTLEEVRARIFIDKRCGTHLHKHHDIEKKSDIHTRMGSTGEGVAEAIIEKLGRQDDYETYAKMEHSKDYQIVDTVKMLNDAYDAGKQILLEGTQGTMLDLHMGTYPYVTSRQTIASAWAAEAGLSPSLQYEVVLVVRRFPIRVAGNSGPFPRELDWIPFMRGINAKREALGLPVLVNPEVINRFEETLSRHAFALGLPDIEMSTLTPGQRKDNASALSNIYKKTLESMSEEDVTELKKLLEMTTVTKKVRRIADLDMGELKYVISLNRPAYMVLNFMNYQFPSLFGVDTVEGIQASPEFEALKTYVKQLEEETGVQVRYINTTADKIIEVSEIWSA